jgi:hypothetical protein
MERFMITSSIKMRVNGRYYWTRDNFNSACNLADSIQELEPNARVTVLDIGCGTIENWQFYIKSRNAGKLDEVIVNTLSRKEDIINDVLKG